MAENGSHQKTFYHGSSVKGIRLLKPFSDPNNTIKKHVVYLTPNENVALFYIWDRPYKFVTYWENEHGAVVYTEWYEDQLDDLTKGLCGSIYECPDERCIRETHVKGVYGSDVPVRVEKEAVIDDVYEEIRKRIADGRVILRTYRSLDEEEKKRIVRCDMVRAIHMEHLLTPGSIGYNAAKCAFIKEHFPLSWSIAEKMNDEEIEEMIEAWRRSV